MQLTELTWSYTENLTLPKSSTGEKFAWTPAVMRMSVEAINGDPELFLYFLWEADSRWSEWDPGEC